MKFGDSVRNFAERLAFIVNGHVGFGDGTNHDNIDGAWVTAMTPLVVNTDFVVVHNLGRIPVGCLVMAKDAACDVYTGSVAATASNLTLRATVAGVTVRLFIV